MHKIKNQYLLRAIVIFFSITSGFALESEKSIQNSSDKKECSHKTKPFTLHQPDLLTTLTLAELYENLHHINEDLEKKINQLHHRSDKKEIIKTLLNRQEEIKTKINQLDVLAQHPEILARFNGNDTKRPSWLFWTLLSITGAVTTGSLFFSSYNLDSGTFSIPSKELLKRNLTAINNNVHSLFYGSQNKNTHSNKTQPNPDQQNDEPNKEIRDLTFEKSLQNEADNIQVEIEDTPIETIRNNQGSIPTINEPIEKNEPSYFESLTDWFFEKTIGMITPDMI